MSWGDVPIAFTIAFTLEQPLSGMGYARAREIPVKVVLVYSVSTYPPTYKVRYP